MLHSTSKEDETFSQIQVSLWSTLVVYYVRFISVKLFHKIKSKKIKKYEKK